MGAPKKIKNPHFVNFLMDEDDVQTLDKIASERNLARADVIREAIKTYIKWQQLQGK